MSIKNRIILCCPTCLNHKIKEMNYEQQEYIMCQECSAVYPVLYNVPFLLDIRQLLKMDQQYLGAWYLSQLNALQLYKDRDPHSIAFASRDDVSQVMSLMDFSNKDVLDIGSGAFDAPEYLTKVSNVKSYYCLDPIEPMQRSNFNLVGGVAELLPFINESFDVVTFITSLDHVFDVENAIRETWRVLRAGGVVYFWGAFTENHELYAKPYPYELLPRIKYNDFEFSSPKKSLKEYSNNLNKYRANLKVFEESGKLFSTLLVDQFHLRHFSMSGLVEIFFKNGFKIDVHRKIMYPGDQFNDFIAFVKY